MRIRLVLLILGIYSCIGFLAVSPADAHRSGCHRWHSCLSDRGTYICGDRGYCSQCPDNQYCEGGNPRVNQTTQPSISDSPPTIETSNTQSKPTGISFSKAKRKMMNIYITGRMRLSIVDVPLMKTRTLTAPPVIMNPASHPTSEAAAWNGNTLCQRPHLAGTFNAGRIGYVPTARGKSSKVENAVVRYRLISSAWKGICTTFSHPLEK